MTIARDPWGGCRRQVHLDFHNSGFITDLGAEWDSRRLARRFKQAHVDSVITFAKCVHGWAYYPSQVVAHHPALGGRDLLGEFIDALHREGIRAPLYTIVGWEENLAQTRPEWLQLCDDGSFAQNAAASDGVSREPGRYRFLNFLHPDYQDYFQAHLDELLGRYPCDGFFVDMLVVHPRADWSDAALRFRARHGLEGRDQHTHLRFEAAAQAAFARRFARQIRVRAPRASLFFNSENRLFTDGRLGVLERAESQTHAEIESLPTGMWGYHHFPRVARALRSRGPWLGMTGRFQRMWGDFGGIKPAPALEFECFRTQGMGGANSIGDQLHPRGTLDEGAYRLIGGVYAQVAAAEPFYAGARPCPAVAVLCPHHPAGDEQRSTQVEEGILQLLHELHQDAAVVTACDRLDGIRLLLIGEGTRLDPALRRRLAAWVRAGGRILACGDAAFAGPGPGWGPFAGLRLLGPGGFAPAYLRARPGSPLGAALGGDARVVYQRGWEARVRRGAVWAERVEPYFNRTDLRFCSHFQAPPRPEGGTPAVVAGPGWVWCADPLFSEVRRSGNLAAKTVLAAAIAHLAGPPAHGWGLKSSVRLLPLRRGRDLLLTLLHYLPERSALDTDIIAERLGFAGQALRLPERVRQVLRWPEGDALARAADGGFLLPAVDGRLLLRVPGFFAHGSAQPAQTRSRPAQ